MFGISIASGTLSLWTESAWAADKTAIDAENSSPALLVLGDSISAAFGIEQTQGWVALLEQKLKQLQYPLRVINASISGETTQGGLQRLPSLLERHTPSLVIVELGGNDGLRGLKLSMIEANLNEIVKLVKASKADVLLAGMRLPPNYGQIYTQKFYQIFNDLARQENIALVPFLMDGVATVDGMMQSDGIHPTADAQEILLNNVWKKLKPMLDKKLARSKK